MIVKKTYLLFIIVFANLTGITSQNTQKKTYKNYIENEQVISENKLDTHASFSSFTSEDTAIHSINEFKQILDGIWKFNWVRDPKDRPQNFMIPTEDVSSWSNIKVPANWEVEGFGVPIYVNHQYEFADYKAPVAEDIEFVNNVPKHPGKVPNNYNPVGSYRRDFNITPNWDGKQIFLHIGSMKSGGFVWIN